MEAQVPHVLRSQNYYELQVTMPDKIVPYRKGKWDSLKSVLTIIITNVANSPPSMKQHFLVCAFQQRYQSWNQICFNTWFLHFLCIGKGEGLVVFCHVEIK